MPSFDPDYYSPLEAAFFFHGGLPPRDRAIDTHFKKLSFANPIPANSTVSGFVFGNLINGPELFNADFFAVGRVERFSFQLALVGLDTDAACFNPSLVYPEAQIVSIEDELQLWNRLAELPCCTSDRAGSKAGDPLNVVIVGDLKTMLSALATRGWHQTEFTTARTVVDTVRSFLLGLRYPHPPISELYFLGRTQDLAVQKVRGDVQQRIHLRLWLAPIQFRQRAVFIGQVSRDIGVKFWASEQGVTTHVIDPDGDEARASLVSDLAYSRALAELAYTRIAGYAKRGQTNLSEDEYFTDGLRAVSFLSDRPIEVEEIRILPWEKPPWEQPLERDWPPR